MAQKRLPRLLMQDMKDLRQAVTDLVAADNTLKTSSWQAAPAVRALIHRAIMVIGPLHDRAEPFYLEILSEQRPRTPWQRAAAAAAGEHPAEDPGAGQENPEDD